MSGEQGVASALRKGKVHCLIIAGDSSDNTRHKFLAMANNSDVPTYIYGEKNSLGQAVGKPRRAIIAVLDRGFSETIQKTLGENGITAWEKN